MRSCRYKQTWWLCTKICTYILQVTFNDHLWMKMLLPWESASKTLVNTKHIGPYHENDTYTSRKIQADETPTSLTTHWPHYQNDHWRQQVYRARRAPTSPLDYENDAVLTVNFSLATSPLALNTLKFGPIRKIYPFYRRLVAVGSYY